MTVVLKKICLDSKILGTLKVKSLLSSELLSFLLFVLGSW